MHIDSVPFFSYSALYGSSSYTRPETVGYKFEKLFSFMVSKNGGLVSNLLKGCKLQDKTVFYISRLWLAG